MLRDEGTIALHEEWCARAEKTFKNKSVLVCGGAGFLGSHLCDRLLGLGADVTCLDNLQTGSLINIQPVLDHTNFSFVEADIETSETFDVDFIFNLACPASPPLYQLDPIRTMRTCVIGSMNLLEQAKKTGARILQASTSEVYGDPHADHHPQTESYNGNVNPNGIRSCYDEGKRAAESLFFDYHREHDVDIRVARIFNTYGPRMRPDDGRVVSNFIVQALQGAPLTIYGNGKQTRSFCFVSDLVEGLLRLMAVNQVNARPVNLGNQDEFTIAELAGLVKDFVTTETSISFKEAPSDDPKIRKPDIGLATQLLNWRPTVPLSAGLAETVLYFAKALSVDERATLNQDVINNTAFSVGARSARSDGSSLRLVRVDKDLKTAPSQPASSFHSNSTLRRWKKLGNVINIQDGVHDLIADGDSVDQAGAYAGNIEKYIGTVKVPMGLVGPIPVRGDHAIGEFYTPLATTEAALVASYARGAMAARKAGGVEIATIDDGVLRCPAFLFQDFNAATEFVEWVEKSKDVLKSVAQKTTRFGVVNKLDCLRQGEIVYLIVRYTTGNAAGQNMATIATDAMCRYIANISTLKISEWFIDGGLSGDKKASYAGVMKGRGRSVCASVTIPNDVCHKLLGVCPDTLIRYHEVAQLGSSISGQFGVQAQLANGLAALYLATGQDVACVAESAVGNGRIVRTDQGVRYTLAMPGIIVGTVGGGTGLPSQKAALSLLGLGEGPNTAAALAEIVCALCLCGEISITASIASGSFTNAHERLARNGPNKRKPFVREDSERVVAGMSAQG